MYILKQKLTLSFLVLALILPTLFFNNIGTAYAQAVPFGGIITNVFPCPCSRSYMITVSPPVPAVVMYVPGITRVYPYYQITRTGVWVLGIYYPGSSYPCLVYTTWGCTTVGGGPIINIVGTSY